ncbi:MAG: UDP-N-acetylglucosamine 1-carboxyvinyltransferase [Bdellovibrionales bacterium]|nr:UDP-N-acetylglucosamine 1-carboxyvinyltransferase [Bdellovibrionales bacterium]
MDKFVVNGGAPLRGTVEAGGSKNCALPVLFATLLSPAQHSVRKVPKLQDMDSTLKMLLHLGCTVDHKHTKTFGADWVINASSLKGSEAPYDLVRKMRASILCLGPLLARTGKARVSLPGGCAIGVRPIDLHLMAMEKLGAEITQSAGYVEAKIPAGKKRLQGAKVLFPLVSVGATENVVMAACLAEGTTIIENAAREPEVRDLCVALISMGAKISGHGTSTITIEGQAQLGAMDFAIPPDRIETATYLIGAHLTGGDVMVEGAEAADLGVVLEWLRKSGATVEVSSKGIRCRSSGTILPVDVTTAPYPGFPTDVQAQWMTLMTQATGDSVITETIFENRFMHVPELQRMGATMDIVGSAVRVKGRPKSLDGAPVMATDLRASASLVLAGLAARGQTEVKRIYHLDRGYESMEVKLRSLGADVSRISEG